MAKQARERTEIAKGSPRDYPKITPDAREQRVRGEDGSGPGPFAEQKDRCEQPSLHSHPTCDRRLDFVDAEKARLARGLLAEGGGSSALAAAGGAGGGLEPT